MISARRGAGTSRHFLKARLAASTAASTSALPDFWKMPTRSRVSAGLRFSNVSPVEDSTHSPSMKFLKTRVWVVLRAAGAMKVSVAMIFRFSFLLMNAWILMLQGARKVRQGGGECAYTDSFRHCAEKQQVPPLRRPWRCGSGGGMTFDFSGGNWTETEVKTTSRASGQECPLHTGRWRL